MILCHFGLATLVKSIITVRCEVQSEWYGLWSYVLLPCVITRTKLL